MYWQNKVLVKFLDIGCLFSVRWKAAHLFSPKNLWKNIFIADIADTADTKISRQLGRRLGKENSKWRRYKSDCARGQQWISVDQGAHYHSPAREGGIAASTGEFGKGKESASRKQPNGTYQSMYLLFWPTRWNK